MKKLIKFLKIRFINIDLAILFFYVIIFQLCWLWTQWPIHNSKSRWRPISVTIWFQPLRQCLDILLSCY